MSAMEANSRSSVEHKKVRCHFEKDADEREIPLVSLAWFCQQNPSNLEELKRLFDEETQKNHVYPFDDREWEARSYPNRPRGGADPQRSKFTYCARVSRLPETAAPNTKNRSLHPNEQRVTRDRASGTPPGCQSLRIWGIKYPELRYYR